MIAEPQKQLQEVRAFLSGGAQTRNFVVLDPSSFAALFAGKPGGTPTTEDELAFQKAFPNDTMLHVPINYDILPELRWKRTKIKEDPNGDVYWEETLPTPKRTYRRVIADHPGTTPWLIEPAVRSEADFDLLDYRADVVRANADGLAESIAGYVPRLLVDGILPGMVILTAFEVYWLIDYPDMPIFYMDWPERYLASIQRIHAANIALLEACAAIGIEIFFTGSAGCELLSPRIFHECIVPVQREFNDHCASLGCYSSYHICGHSRQLIEQKIIDALKPTIFETCSALPCGNNESLRDAVRGISYEIITKGNLSLELMRNGTPDQIAEAVRAINDATAGRRHIIGQADATILAGTPHENIRTFVETAWSLDHEAPAATMRG